MFTVCKEILHVYRISSFNVTDLKFIAAHLHEHRTLTASLTV